jgi:hypothetical protein
MMEWPIFMALELSILQHISTTRGCPELFHFVAFIDLKTFQFQLEQPLQLQKYNLNHMGIILEQPAILRFVLKMKITRPGRQAILT